MARKFAEVQFVIKDCAKCGIFVNDKDIRVDGEVLKVRAGIVYILYKSNIDKFFENMRCIGYEIVDYYIERFRDKKGARIFDDVYIEFEFKYVGGVKK